MATDCSRTPRLDELDLIHETGRLLSVHMSEDDLVGEVAKGLRGLFPGRHFAIRLIDSSAKALTSLYSEGPLLGTDHRILRVQRSTPGVDLLPRAALDDGLVELTDSFQGVFRGSEGGFSLPLTAVDELLGLMNVEGEAEQFEDPALDIRLAGLLANQLSTAINSARSLRKSRYLGDYLNGLIDNANALVLALDARGEVTVFNRALQTLTGLSPSDVIGRSYLHLFPPEDRAEMVRVVELAKAGESSENVEAALTSSSGTGARVCFSTASIKGAEGVVESVVAIGHDLTRVWELERRVIQAEKLASIGQLSAAVVHELNNPLTSILVYGEYVRERLSAVGTERDVEKAERIVESADRVLKFSKNLTAYARPSDERLVRVDLRAIVEQSRRLCDHVMDENGVVFRLEWAEDAPPVMGVAGKLQQVFINLITNACHALDVGGTLTVTGTGDETRVRVVVADDGPGITPENKRRLFEPFFSTKPAGAGTGLGLPIVLEIVRRHGGELRVESEPGEGARFVLTLPAAPDEES